MKTGVKLTIDQLNDLLKEGERKITIGGKYYHYKNRSHTYTVIDLAIQEATGKACVIYKSDYTENVIFVRDLDVWLETILVKGKKVKRFTKIS